MKQADFYQISNMGELRPLASLEEALLKLNEEGFIWMSFVKPDKSDFEPLIEPLNLCLSCIEDCIDHINNIPKINEYSQNAFLIFNTFKYSGHNFNVQEISFFLGGNYLITVSRSEFTSDHPLFELENKIMLEMEQVRQGAAFLLHLILDQIVDHTFAFVEKISDALIQQEDTMLSQPSKFRPSALQRLRRDLITLRKSIFNEKEILVKICRNDIPFIPKKALLRYRDIYDHLNKLFETAEMERENATIIMQLNLSIANNRMAESANKTNASVRRLTLITTIFMPLTLITGIGGMSEFTMMTGAENWRFVYPVMLIALGVIGAVNYILLKRLEKKDNEKD